MNAGIRVFVPGLMALWCANATATTSAEAFRLKHGSNWRVATDSVRGSAIFVYGSRLSVGWQPITNADYERAARDTVRDNPELFGCNQEHLQLRKVRRLDLDRFGSADKVAIIFDQVVDGIPVFGGSVTLLFLEATGELIGIAAQAIPGADLAAPLPHFSSTEALGAIIEPFNALCGTDYTSVEKLEVVIVGDSQLLDHPRSLRNQRPRLAYYVVASAPGHSTSGDQPAIARFIVSAESALDILRSELFVNATTGTVQGIVNADEEPSDTVGIEDLEYVELADLDVLKETSPGVWEVVATTDENGSFDTGFTGSEDLRFELAGEDLQVSNLSGANARIEGTYSGDIEVTFNNPVAEFTTAEVAAAFWWNTWRQWVKDTDPDVTEFEDNHLTIEVNEPGPGCQGRYSGDKVIVRRAGGSCYNSAFRALILHELGHWGNDKLLQFGTFDITYNEGLSDAWYHAITGDNCLHTAHHAGGCLRLADQTEVRKCPRDGTTQCNGIGEFPPPIKNRRGMPINSALWEVRSRLSNHSYYNQLFLAWLDVYDDGDMNNVIQEHWLLLDDDNGDLSDLTPNYEKITEGFQSYAWPVLGPRFSHLSYPEYNAELPEENSSPIVVSIDPVVGVLDTAAGYEPTLHYRETEGTWVSVTMTDTPIAGQYEASIPAFSYNTTIEWYVEAHSKYTLSSGVTRSISTFPARVSYIKGAGTDEPSWGNVIHVGKRIVHESADFESDDGGWTTTSGPDEWEYLRPERVTEVTNYDPFGPNYGVAVSKQWGTDLGVENVIMGGPPRDTETFYDDNSSQELKSASYDLSVGGISGWRMQYSRWLTVEDRTSDVATIEAFDGVNPRHLLFQNPLGRDLVDWNWIRHDLDVSEMDDEANVEFIFGLVADDSVTYGGWNLDDFELYYVNPDPNLGNFVRYGEVFDTIAGPGPLLSGIGNPKIAGAACPSPVESQVVIRISGGSPNGEGVLFAGIAQVCVPLGSGGTQYIDSVVDSETFELDGNGDADITIDMGCVTAGDYYLQAFVYPPGGVPPQLPSSPPNEGRPHSNGLWMHAVD